MGDPSTMMSASWVSGIIQSMSSRWMHRPGVFVQHVKQPVQPLMSRSVV